jgi:hypothetical protein
VVAVAHGFGHWEYGNVSRGKSFKSSDPDTRAVWWSRDGVHPNPIIPIRKRPGMEWHKGKDLQGMNYLVLLYPAVSVVSACDNKINSLGKGVGYLNF